MASYFSMRPSWLFVALSLLSPLALRAQQASAPVLTNPGDAPYPTRAWAEHVQGTAVVRFGIGSDGHVTAAVPVSGPSLLVQPLQQQIKTWRFVTPLPEGAARAYVATYTYALLDPTGDADAVPSGGNNTDTSRTPDRAIGQTPSAEAADDVPEQETTAEVKRLGGKAAVYGVVRSLDNRQWVDTTPAAHSLSPAH